MTPRDIPLTQGKVAIVDDEDYARIAAHKWYALRDHNYNRWYATRNMRCGGKRTKVYMHRAILGLALGCPPEIDHRNGDGLDNRRENLRVATSSQNQANGKPPRNNRSGVKGVCWHKRDRKWHARIQTSRWETSGGGHRKVRAIVRLGSFATKEQATEAYRRGAERLFGDFAFHRRSEGSGT